MQARSTARLTRLLDSAAEVIGEIGYERLTTAMVAERAGASIGTVYRYFPDRIAILQSLSDRFLNEFADDVRAALAEGPSSAEAAVDAIIDSTLHSFATKPGFRSLRFGDVLDVRPIESGHSKASLVSSLIANSLVQRYGFAEGEETAFRAEILVTVVDALLARAFMFDLAGDKRIIAEARAAARRILVS